MFIDRLEITAEIQDLAAAACVELMGAYDVVLEPTQQSWDDSDEVLFSGVMGFVSDSVRGTCLLAAPESTLRAAAPDAAILRDWVGELANQLVGRLKSKLMARGETIKLSTPVVLSGVRLSPLPRTQAQPALFASSAGRVMVWLEVEVAPGFELGAERPLCASEGEFLMF